MHSTTAAPPTAAPPTPASGRSRRRTGIRAWVVTCAATVASTYALDVLATAGGALLVASGLLRGLDHSMLLVFLVATYVFWGAGLRVNLKANWALLSDTGTSTNALSKVAHDVVKSRRPASPRARRLAASSGYLIMELVKEAPYYAGAFGAALLSDSISANDALIFLGGANLAAAGYEYGLARLTRGFLARRDRRAASSSPSQSHDAPFASAVE